MHTENNFDGSSVGRDNQNGITHSRSVAMEMLWHTDMTVKRRNASRRVTLRQVTPQRLRGGVIHVRFHQ